MLTLLLIRATEMLDQPRRLSRSISLGQRASTRLFPLVRSIIDFDRLFRQYRLVYYTEFMSEQTI